MSDIKQCDGQPSTTCSCLSSDGSLQHPYRAHIDDCSNGQQFDLLAHQERHRQSSTQTLRTPIYVEFGKVIRLLPYKSSNSCRSWYGLPREQFDVLQETLDH